MIILVCSWLLGEWAMPRKVFLYDLLYSKGRSHLQDLSFITRGFVQQKLHSSDIANIIYIIDMCHCPDIQDVRVVKLDFTFNDMNLR